MQLPENVTTQKLRTIALSKEINLRYFENGDVGISVDETTTRADANLIVNLLELQQKKQHMIQVKSRKRLSCHVSSDAEAHS